MHKLFTLALLFSVNHCFGMEETERPTTPTRRERTKSPSCDSFEAAFLKKQEDEKEQKEQTISIATFQKLSAVNTARNNKKKQQPKIQQKFETGTFKKRDSTDEQKKQASEKWEALALTAPRLQRNKKITAEQCEELQRLAEYVKTLQEGNKQLQGKRI